MARRPSKRDLSTGILIVLLAGVLVSQAMQATADHQPANKVAASGSEPDMIPPGDATAILSETLKISSPKDLVLSVTLECSIITLVTTVGNQDSSAEGRINVWVEIDGTVVPVSVDDTTEPGKVVFCNRRYQRRTSNFDDTNATIETFMRTRSANAFNWMAIDTGTYDQPNVPPGTGNNIVKIEVFAELITSTACPPAGGEPNCSTGVVGHRTLVVEPVKASNDETVTALA